MMAALDALGAAFADGRIVDLVLVLVGLEALALLAWRHVRGRGPASGGPSPTGLLANLASGAALMGALRFALTGAAWPLVAGCLALALAAHVADLVLRWRDHPAAPPHPASLGRSREGTPGGTPGETAAFPARKTGWNYFT